MPGHPETPKEEGTQACSKNPSQAAFPAAALQAPRLQSTGLKQAHSDLRDPQLLPGTAVSIAFLR